MENKMTIHRGLSELKLIDSKIEKQIGEIAPVGVFQKGKLINQYIVAEDFNSAATSKYDSITDLINRKIKIKSAIVAANGTTRVKIAESEMTIADAISLKENIKFKKNLIISLRQKFAQNVGQLNNNNSIVEQNVQRLLEATFGKENVKVGATDIESVRKPYIESNEWHLADPLKISEKINSLEKEVGDFESEVDAVLSEINAVTFINF